VNVIVTTRPKRSRARRPRALRARQRDRRSYWSRPRPTFWKRLAPARPPFFFRYGTGLSVVRGGAMTDIGFFGAAGTGSRYLGDSRAPAGIGRLRSFSRPEAPSPAQPGPLSVPPQEVDAIILTYAHLDHSGYLLALVRDGFRDRSTPLTRRWTCAASFCPTAGPFHRSRPSQGLRPAPQTFPALSFIHGVNRPRQFFQALLPAMTMKIDSLGRGGRSHAALLHAIGVLIAALSLSPRARGRAGRSFRSRRRANGPIVGLPAL
jgi:hypothetical protein